MIVSTEGSRSSMTRQNIIAMAKFELGASLLNCGALVTMHTKDDVTKKSQRGAGAYPALH